MLDDSASYAKKNQDAIIDILDFYKGLNKESEITINDLAMFFAASNGDMTALVRAAARVNSFAKSNSKSFVKKSIPMLFRPVNRTKFKSEISELKEKASQTSTCGIIAALAGMRDRPNREILLKSPPYPVHIIAGDKDPRISYKESCELADISEFVKLHTIKGSGHMSYIEAPNQTLEIFNTVLK